MKTWKFKAIIDPGPGGGAFVTVPFDSQQEFGSRGSIPVQCTFDGVPYRGSLMPCGGPNHLLGILKSIRKKTGKNIGDAVEVVLWKDDQQRNVEVPEEMRNLMDQSGVTLFFESLSYTHRKEYVRWITEAKTEATRQRRLEKSMEMLMQRVKTPG
jgi:hypothetical protein